MNQLQIYQKARDSKKIRDCTDEELNAQLRYAVAVLGIQKTDKETGMAIRDSLRRNFGNFGVEEIRAAIDRVISGNEQWVEPYGILSMAYFSKVLNCYREAVRKKLTQPQGNGRIEKVSEKEKEMAEKRFIENLLIPIFEEYKKTGTIRNRYALNSAYEILKKRVDITKEEKWKVWEEAKLEYKNRDIHYGTAPRKLEQFIEQGKVSDTLKVISQRIAAVRVFDELISAGQDMKKLLNQHQ